MDSCEQLYVIDQVCSVTRWLDIGHFRSCAFFFSSPRKTRLIMSHHDRISLGCEGFIIWPKQNLLLWDTAGNQFRFDSTKSGNTWQNRLDGIKKRWILKHRNSLYKWRFGYRFRRGCLSSLFPEVCHGHTIDYHKTHLFDFSVKMGQTVYAAEESQNPLTIMKR